MEEPINQITSTVSSPPVETATLAAVAATKPKLPPIKSLFKESWALFKSRFTKSILIQLLGIVPIVLLILLGILTFAGFANSDAFKNPIVIVTLVIIGIIALVLFGLFSVWIQAAQIMIFAEPQANLTIKRAMRDTKSKVLSLWWVMFLSGFVVIGGFLLFIIPGIIISVMISFAAYALLIDNKRGMDALMTSREYVRGYWWAVFGRALLGGIVVYSGSIVIAIATSGINEYVSVVLQNIYSFVIGSFLIAYIFTVYKHLKSIKGEVTAPIDGRKKYIIVAVLGFALIPAAIVIFITLSITNRFSETLETNPTDEYNRTLIE